MIEVLIHFFTTHTLLLDVVLLGFGFLAGRFPQFAIGIRVAIFVVKMAQYYFKNHPLGKKMAKETKTDEEINHFYNERLAELDETSELSCLGAGESVSVVGNRASYSV